MVREPILKQPPSFNTADRLLASFHGVREPDGDDEPSVKTIWIGLQRVMDFADGIRVCQIEEICV